MLLVNPPALRPCEAPAGLAQLSGTLAAHGVPHGVLDAGLECTLDLAQRGTVDGATPDTWTARALRNASRNLATLRAPEGYSNFSRYSRAVHDLERALGAAGRDGWTPGLATVEHRTLSPLSTADLIRAAEDPAASPYFAAFAPRLERALAEHAATVVGFSISYLDQALSAFAMMGWLRRHHPGVRIVAGGGLVTSWSSHLDLAARCAGLVDRFVAGPGDRAVLELCGVTVATEESRPPTRAPGACGPDLTRFPLERYLAPGVIVPCSASSGCWWGRCRFCPERAEGNRYLPVPANDLRTAIDGLVARHRPALLHLTDNALPPAVLRSLVQRPPGVPWYGFARFTSELLEPDFCRGLRTSGCTLLKLGLESGSERVLEEMDKGFRLADAMTALRNLQEAGVPTYVYVLFGTPAETERDARRTLDVLAECAGAIGFLNVAVFNLPLAAPEATRLATRPFYRGDLSLYADFEHPSGWDRRSVKRFIDRELRRHPAIAPILRRDPPIFTSSHAPFFTR